MTYTLPQQPTAFIGREAETEDIVSLLEEPSCRLLTLAGPGGIGKTRLAVQAAADAQSDFEDGVCFVALQPVGSADLLVPALADALGMKFIGSEPPRTQLLHHLHLQNLLLVMDNFEHLLDDVELVTDLLEAAPRIKLLVTSRETLNVREEWVRAIPPMRVPDDDQTSALEGYDAVQLFIARARQAGRDVAIDQERQHVIRICQLVEGLPLAIELAAAQTRTRSCAQIADDIQESMDVLSTPLRNVPERHRDLYHVFEPCWNRLTETQRYLFTRLSVFRGGFERDAAEQVAGASLSDLAALVDKSLLSVTPSGRYQIHELVRQYAEARLLEEQSSESEHVRDRHCDYYADFLQQQESDLHGSELLRALSDVRPEIDNIRTMWQWAVERGNWDAIARCLDSLGFILQNRAAWREGSDTFGNAVNALGDTSSILTGRLLMWQGQMQASFRANQQLQEGATILGDSGLHHADPMTYQHLVFNCRSSEDIDHLEQRLLSALAQFRRQSNQWKVANVLVWLGCMAEVRGDLEQYEARMAEALALYRATGNLWGISSAVQGMADVNFQQQRYEASWRLAEECTTACTAINDPAGIAFGLLRMGRPAYALGNYPEAKQLLEKGLRKMAKMSMLDGFPVSLAVLGAATCRLGDCDQARYYLRGALRRQKDRWLSTESWLLSEAITTSDLAATLSLTARWLAATGSAARAVEVLGAVLPLLSGPDIRHDADELLADLETKLTPDEFSAAWARAEGRDLRELAAAVLEELDSPDESHLPAGDLPPRLSQPLIEPLSPRELEVLALIIEGCRNQEIADRLCIGGSTVKKHINHIFGKLGVDTRARAIARARELGLF